MAVVRCNKGHYYDGEKNSQCPHCGIFSGEEGACVTEIVQVQDAKKNGSEDKTVAINSEIYNLSSGMKRVPSQETDAEDKTISLYAVEKGADFIVGWVVCTRGPERGRDYKLHQGFNRLGRDYTMDIAIMDDSSIGREAACAIVYDDRGNLFFAVQQPGATAYLNGTVLEGAIALKSGDLICIGNSEFEFVAFCREGRIWE